MSKIASFTFSSISIMHKRPNAAHQRTADNCIVRQASMRGTLIPVSASHLLGQLRRFEGFGSRSRPGIVWLARINTLAVNVPCARMNVVDEF
jgi:hypothetical protein